MFGLLWAICMYSCCFFWSMLLLYLVGWAAGNGAQAWKYRLLRFVYIAERFKQRPGVSSFTGAQEADI